MGARMVLGAAVIAMLMASCGDPDSAGSPIGTAAVATTVPATIAATEIAVCVDPPFLGTGTPPSLENQGTQLSELASAHPELFAGVWWDGQTEQFVVGTIDATAAAQLLDPLQGSAPFRVEVVPRSHDQLQALQARAVPLMTEQRLADSSSEQVWDGTIRIDLRILDQRSIDAVKAVFADDLSAVCVTGADPATVPADGPQPTSGDGWRLLADADRHGAPYDVHVALNQAEYETLWASLSLDGSPSAVDFATEIVVHFGAVYGSSCPEIRLDGVDIDTQAATIEPHMVLLGGSRGCTADAIPRAYVVAIAKDHLPPLPFTVAVQECGACASTTVDDLTSNSAPALDLDPWARGSILAVAAAARLNYAPDRTTQVDVVGVLGRATEDGIVDLSKPGAELTEGEQSQIAQALAAYHPRFIDKATFDATAKSDAPPDHVVLTLAEPRVIGTQLTVTVGEWCGNLCGTSGAFAVAQGSDGLWHSTGPVGPQPEA